MLTTVNNHWRCPNCGLPLYQRESAIACANNHSFDIAKEGYVNLLINTHKNSNVPGDNKQMITARRNFLQLDLYAPLANYIKDIIGLKLSGQENKQHQKLLDAGCGEGYYLRKIMERFSESELDCSGIDVSKFGIQKAAKLSPLSSFCVASTFHMPVKDNSQDILLQIFAPASLKEIKRVLKADGLWINVTPGPKHLFELKKFVYETPHKHKDSLQDIGDLKVRFEHQIKFQFTLTSGEQRNSLLAMTPFYWTISESKKQNLLDNLTLVTADFIVRGYSPK